MLLLGSCVYCWRKRKAIQNFQLTDYVSMTFVHVNRLDFAFYFYKVIGANLGKNFDKVCPGYILAGQNCGLCAESLYCTIEIFFFSSGTNIKGVVKLNPPFSMEIQVQISVRNALPSLKWHLLCATLRVIKSHKQIYLRFAFVFPSEKDWWLSLGHDPHLHSLHPFRYYQHVYLNKHIFNH